MRQEQHIELSLLREGNNGLYSVEAFVEKRRGSRGSSDLAIIVLSS